MKSKRNIVWAVVWGILAAAFGALHVQGYALYSMPTGQTLSQVLMIVSAILAGFHLGALMIGANVKIRRGVLSPFDF